MISGRVDKDCTPIPGGNTYSFRFVLLLFHKIYIDSDSLERCTHPTMCIYVGVCVVYYIILFVSKVLKQCTRCTYAFTILSVYPDMYVQV
jgi:hypothetical protein